ncbi:MAG TPA: LacI family DNA-binding transcriptional regulator [Ktedonobacteraceae bacterium]
MMGANKDSRARLQDVATAAGVHVGTASRALNAHTTKRIRPETVERVRRVAEELGYHVNTVARALKTRRSYLIGCLLPDLGNAAASPVMRGMERTLSAAGYSLIVANTDDDAENARRLADKMLQSSVDGLLISTARRKDALVEQLRHGFAPFVLVNRTVDRGGVWEVVYANQYGLRLVVEYLAQLGHQQIGYVGGPGDTSTGMRRMEGFVDAAQALGISYAPVSETTHYTLEEGLRVGSILLNSHPDLTAIVTGNDLLALGVIKAAATLGLVCPRDLSVVGFNDMPLVDQMPQEVKTRARESLNQANNNIERPAIMPQISNALVNFV